MPFIHLSLNILNETCAQTATTLLLYLLHLLLNLLSKCSYRTKNGHGCKCIYQILLPMPELMTY